MVVISYLRAIKTHLPPNKFKQLLEKFKDQKLFKEMQKIIKSERKCKSMDFDEMGESRTETKESGILQYKNCS